MNNKILLPRLLIAIAIWLGTWSVFVYLLPDSAKHNNLAMTLISSGSLFSGLAVTVLILTLTRTGKR